MTDPLATARVLKQQRDEWKRKYEEELDAWDWLEANRFWLISAIDGDWRVEDLESYQLTGTTKANAESPREAVRKAMEGEK